MRPRMLALALVLAAAGALAPWAAASDRVGLDATQVRLAVSADGETAVVTYRSHGLERHVLVSGATNALPPSQVFPQVRFAGIRHAWFEHEGGYLLARRACDGEHVVVMPEGVVLLGQQVRHRMTGGDVWQKPE